MQHLLRTGAIQAKLTVSQPNDPHEREADRMAEQVLRTPIQRQAQNASAPLSSPANSAVSLPGTGMPLDPATRAYFEPQFGQDFSSVRVHTDSTAQDSAAAIQARAYTSGSHIVFQQGEYAPDTSSGKHLLAHELTHVVQQAKGVTPSVQRYGTPIPDVPPATATVKTMQQFIDLVKRIEAANPGLTAMQIAQMIMRTKYNSTAWDFLLPSSAKGAQVTATGSVTADDVTTLAGELREQVILPQGGSIDPSHIVAAIIGNAETQAPGSGGSAGVKGAFVSNPPTGLSQRDIVTWVGDIASAAAEWQTVHPLPSGGTSQQNYMDEFAPESDLIGDIDGLAMTSTNPAFGFVFDPTIPLSTNLEHFYFPAKGREGKNRRFHTFCAVEGLALEADNVTLSAGAIANMENRVRLNTDWFEKNDPNLLTWVALQSPPTTSSSGLGSSGDLSFLFNPIPREWVKRANDWHWFADKFRDFVQKNLKAEGA